MAMTWVLVLLVSASYRSPAVTVDMATKDACVMAAQEAPVTKAFCINQSTGEVLVPKK